jgi:hypothetical protein
MIENHPSPKSASIKFHGFFKFLWVLVFLIPGVSTAQTPTPTLTPLPPIGDGMLASYYNNTTLSGTPAYSRVEESSNLNWFLCSPEDGIIQPDNFSARFTGFLVPPAGSSAPYTFIVTPQNGGVSLSINNSAVISQWPGPSSASATAVVTLAASSPVPLEMDYTAATGSAAVNLSWKYSTASGLQLININYLYSGQPAVSLPLQKTVTASGVACQPATLTEDGIFSEPAWQGPWTPVIKTADGSTAGTSAQFKTLWDNQYLYVGVTVIKNPLSNAASQAFNNDTVEVFLNTDDVLGPTNQPDDFGFTFGWNNPIVGERQGRTTGVLFSTATLPNGYTLEAAIPWSTLGVAPSAGATLGFDLGVYESDAGCRAGELIWNGTFFDTVDSRSFGALALSACSIPPALSSPFVSPNPFTPGHPPNDLARFNLNPYHGPGHLVVTDLRRRKIRSIDFQASQVVSWDGRNDAGNGVSPGVYVFILQVDGVVHRSSVTVMR